MKKFRVSYEPPIAPYRAGQKLKIGTKVYTIISSTHTHTLFQGFEYATANWIIAHMKKTGRELE